MRALKCTAALLAFVLLGCALSVTAVYSFWIAARLFHSVPMARACDAAGNVVLIPVRCFFWMLGSGVDQSTPLFEPLRYAATNGVLLGAIGYACCRRFLFFHRG